MRVRFPYKLGHRQRLGRQDWGELSSSVTGAEMTSGQPGATLSRSTQGTNYHFRDPDMPWWGFVRLIDWDEEAIIVSPARRAPGGLWLMDDGVSRLHPAPNYLVEHFEKFVIGSGGLEPTDRAVIVIAGYAVPDFRMLLVEPVAVEELCEPCEESNA